MDGYGSPTPAAGAFDSGYGSPSGTFLDSGYGSPSSASEALSLALQPYSEAFPDDGGEVVTLLGVFTVTPGPYYVRLIGQDGTYFPSAGGYCYSGVKGLTDACYPDKAAETMTFVLPPMPPGLYDVEVSYGPTKGTKAILTGALPVKRRTYALETYDLRNALPGWWDGLGPLDVREEPTL